MENMHSCLEIETQNKDDNIVNLCISRFEPRESTDFPCEGGSSYTCVFQMHFMKSCDEIYRIDICQSPKNHREIYSIFVVRLDFSLLKWKEVKKFGDLVLFRDSTACCSASDLGLTYGCLYYTLPGDLSFYKFEFPSNGVAVILPCLKLPQPWFLSDWIMIPDGHRRKNTLLVKDEEETDCIPKAVESNISPIEVNETEIENQGRKLNGGELEEEEIPWNILDMDSVELISNHLHHLDYIHFRLVRKANRAIMPITKLALTSTARIEKATHLSLWLLFYRDNIYNFINPKHDNENYLMNQPDLVECTIRFQKEGWLLLTKEDHKLFFYNPLTRENIQLPSLPDNYCFSGITFSSTPTSSDCIVFGIEQSWPGRISIYFIKHGEHVWNIFSFDNVDLERYHPLLSTPVIKDMAFYFVDYNGTLGVLSLEDNSWTFLEKPVKDLVPNIHVSWWSVDKIFF